MPEVWSRSSFIVSSSFIKSLLSDSAALAWELNVEGKLITEMICSAGVTTKVMKTLIVLLPGSFPEWLSAKTATSQNHDNETKQKKKEQLYKPKGHLKILVYRCEVKIYIFKRLSHFWMTSKMSFDGPKNKDFIREQIDSKTNFAATYECLLQLFLIVAVS